MKDLFMSFISYKFRWPAGDGDGIIVEFDNHIKALHGFNCVWISQYKEEAEVLFMSVSNKIRIVGVTIMETKNTYQIYFRALGQLNDTLNGKRRWIKSDLAVICDLIDWKVNNKHNRTVDEYIYNSFLLYTDHKLELKLNYNLYDCDPEIVNKTMYKKYEFGTDPAFDPFSDSQTSTLFRGDIIFKLFNNLRSIIIDAKFCELSFKYLLLMISQSG